ncbi:MAG TPA: YceI family protein [Chitinophagaceae bacterium]|nr:YceI family protein [Chitinophagaceae bacterium]
MKKLLTIATLFFLISCNDAPKQTVATTEAVTPEATTISSSSYTVDTAASSLQWEGYEGLSLGDAEHAGSLKISKGVVRTDSSIVTGGEFSFNMNSLAVTDIPATSPKNEKLKKHLLSADFFDAGKFPEAGFVVTGVTPKGADSATVSGNLTLKGTEKNISFPVAIQLTNSVIKAVSPIFYINRKDWGMHYRSENSLGDEMIRNELGIKINIIAHKF